MKKTFPDNKSNTINPSTKRKALLGVVLITLSIVILISMVSFFYNWEEDQSEFRVAYSDIVPQNSLKKSGNDIGFTLGFYGFGLGSFSVVYILFIWGMCFLLDKGYTKVSKYTFWGLYMMIWIALLMTYLHENHTVYGGMVGYELNAWLYPRVGKMGIGIGLLLAICVYFLYRWNITPLFVVKFCRHIFLKLKRILSLFKKTKSTKDLTISDVIEGEDETVFDLDIIRSDVSKSALKEEAEDVDTVTDLSIEITNPEHEPTTHSIKKTESLDPSSAGFDPRLELSQYQNPVLDLLKGYGNGEIKIDNFELEENKTKIVETLKHYNIDISNIKATIGPTITLYEIIPEKGIRISKIKNLEDDIALSLSALGIRIIAPIPGKGTIGIEVPNKHSSIVSMRSVIASSKFQETDMELPLAIGKTISNETFVVDLAKMPHLLLAGATGQGKSVGLNAILTSLLYKKHPAEIKFVLVDPKKVELTLFSKIERHFLAKLPDSEEAIITDNNKVINSLNSLCIEMDNRYELLKNAQVRNLKEYNEKFKSRRLNPENGHRYLPYIILIIDEFADLIMTAGKEVETPIARLAQLARAIGIHLIIATQRPSVNVITGLIKANFPARIAFRVTSKIDSRTILDFQGADQLIGRGDMLYTQGNDLTRLQCPFVDTPEVEAITNFIGSQTAFPESYFLPEYEREEQSNSEVDVKEEKDALFKEAAEVIVIAQQGSTSLLQRKLKLGYNRAGRLIDQLESSGIVGPFEGSKARQVLIPDLETLHKIMNDKDL